MAPNDELTGSILTPSQRKYLRDKLDEDPSDANERMIRKRIRNRLRIAMTDFSTILRNLSDEDLDSAFIEPIRHGYGVREDPKQSIPDAIGVLYLGSIATDETQGIRGLESVRTDDMYRETPLIHPSPFGNRAQKGIRRALVRRGIDVQNVTVDVDIDVAGTIEQEERDLSQFSISMLDRLKLAGKITEKEYVHALAHKVDMDPDEFP